MIELLWLYNLNSILQRTQVIQHTKEKEFNELPLGYDSQHLHNLAEEELHCQAKNSVHQSLYP